MPLQLLDFPEELLEKCLQYLPPRYPHIEPCSTSHVPQIPLRKDLCSAILTCRAFRRIASPWLWRRLEFDLGGRETEDPVFARLRDHPELANYIEFLLIMYYVGGERHVATLVGLLPAVRFMENLRVLRFVTLSVDSTGVLALMFRELMSKPRLHTLQIQTTQHLGIPVPPSPLHLRRLCYSMTEINAWLLNSFHRLESLAIVRPCWPPDPPTLPIPWETLRDIEIEHDENWHHVLQNFSAWKQTFPNTRSPLNEVSICAYSPQLELLSVPAVFKGQRLSTLSLVYVSFVDGALLRQIVDFFPHLRTLGLRTWYYSKPWDVDLETIAETLGRLRYLMHLRWNFSIAEHLPPSLLYQHVLSPVIDRCPTLELIRQDDSLYFIRQRDGRFHCEVEPPGAPVMERLHNSSWQCSAYDLN